MLRKQNGVLNFKQPYGDTSFKDHQNEIKEFTTKKVKMGKLGLNESKDFIFPLPLPSENMELLI